MRELSGTLGVDTARTAAPTDTVILSVRPATYSVVVDGVPPNCAVREGPERVAVVPENSNTTVARFGVDCRAPLAVQVLTEGPGPAQYVVAVDGPASRVLAIAPTDSTNVDALPAGDYTIALRLVPEACTVVSDGGARQRLAIAERGGAVAAFRVLCAPPGAAPHLVRFAGSALDSTAAFTATVVDTGRDVESYTWDVTDCRRRSLLPNGPVRRRGLSARFGARLSDTVTLVAAFDTPIPAGPGPRCQALWLADERGHATAVQEIPLVPPAAPPAVTLDARTEGTRLVRATLAPAGPAAGVLGLFVVYVVRDGVLLRPPDGRPDRLVLDPGGLLGTAIPDLGLNAGQGLWDDYLAVVVWAVRADGSFARLERSDLVR